MQHNYVLYLSLVSLLLIGCGEVNNPNSDTKSSSSESAALDSKSSDSEGSGPDSSDPGAANDEAPDSENSISEAANSSTAVTGKSQSEPPNPDTSETSNAGSNSQTSNSASGLGSASRPINITFDDVKLDIKPDVVYDKSMLSDRVRELEGKYVRIRGFICAEATFKQKDIKQFILIKNNQCKFGVGGQFHHNMAVHLKPADAIDFTTRAVTVEGKLTLKPMNGPNGKTWTLYHLEG